MGLAACFRLHRNGLWTAQRQSDERLPGAGELLVLGPELLLRRWKTREKAGGEGCVAETMYLMPLNDIHA